MFKTIPLVTALLAAAALSMGCASQRIQSVDDALLAEVSADQMTLVKQSRSSRDEAADGLAKASRDTAWAEDQTNLVRAELKSTLQQLEESKLATLLSEKNGTSAELQAAKRRHEQLTAQADATREKLSHRKRVLEYKKLVAKVALERSRLAEAEVELAKARAVQELDRVAAKKVPVREFEKQVSFYKTEVAIAEVRANAANELVAEAEVDFRASEAKAASFTKN